MVLAWLAHPPQKPWAVELRRGISFQWFPPSRPTARYDVLLELQQVFGPREESEIWVTFKKLKSYIYIYLYHIYIYVYVIYSYPVGFTMVYRFFITWKSEILLHLGGSSIPGWRRCIAERIKWKWFETIILTRKIALVWWALDFH